MRLGVSRLITIGGDDTAYSAMRLVQTAAGRLQIVHVPKTIDNDLDLPAYVDTYGFQAARHHYVEIVKNLMVDAKTTLRWYFVIVMGRTARHLAMGIGKAAGATLTLIREEFPTQQIRFETIVDTRSRRATSFPCRSGNCLARRQAAQGYGWSTSVPHATPSPGAT